MEQDILDTDLLTTGAAAAFLGSRQHVVDMCQRGELPYLRIGSHRRLRRADLEAVIRPVLRRNQERSLWLHRAVAGYVSMDPDATLATARRNLNSLLVTHPVGPVREQLHRWQVLIDGSLDEVFHVLASRSGPAIELRQNSPFAGVLSEPDRQRVLHAFRTHWHRSHVTQVTER